MQTRSRSHNADITADHLGDAYEKWCAELDIIGQLIHALQQIAKGER